MNLREAVRLSLTLLLTSLPLVGQGNRWHSVTINVPDATETWVRGVNNHGEIVGFYKPRNSTCLQVLTNPQVPTCSVRGFKIVNGVLTKLNVPGADQHGHHGGQ